MFSPANIRASVQSSIRGFSTLSPKCFPLPLIQGGHGNFTKYGGCYTITLLPGDGIGPEITNSVKAIFKAANAPVEWEQYNVTGDFRDDGLLKTVVDSLRRNKVGLKGIFFTPVSQFGRSSFNVAMRKELDIYASASIIKNIKGYPSKHKDVDFVIIRENTEGEYSGLEHTSYPGVVESLKVCTKAKTQRIAKFAFDFALKNNRKKVTCVHKANIMKLGDGLFLNTCREVAKQYESAGIKFDDMIVDNAAMQLVSKPQQFDVLVMGNLYGNITSNVGAALVGGPGIVPGANIGADYAVFEPGCRHVAMDIQGRNSANPTAMILSSVLLLRHLHLDDVASKISSAIFKTLAEKTARTPDMGGTSTTTDFTLAVIANL